MWEPVPSGDVRAAAGRGWRTVAGRRETGPRGSPSGARRCLRRQGPADSANRAARVSKRLPLLIVLALGALSLRAVEIKPAPALDTDFYHLRSLTYEEARQAAGPFLSADGKLGHVPTRGILVITDHPANIEVVKKILTEIDTAPANIRVDITFDSAGEAGENSAELGTGGVRITREGGHTRISGGAAPTVQSVHTTTSSLVNQFVLAGNNRPAQIWVGSEVADPAWVLEYGTGHGWWAREVAYRQIGASLWVRPRITADGLIELEVFPRLTARGTGMEVIDVQALGTRITVADGQPVSLGGLSQDKCEAYRHLFGVGKVFDGRRLGITLRATILQVKPRGPPPSTVPANTGKN